MSNLLRELTRRQILVPAVVVSVVISIVSFGVIIGAGGPSSSGSDDGNGTASAGGDAVEITIKDFAFDPTPVTVAPGAEITWTNQDEAIHTATGGEVDTGNIAKGESATATAPEAGSVDYICSIHPSMKASIEVK